MATMSTMAVDYDCSFQALSHILLTQPDKVDDKKSTMNARTYPIR